MTQKARMLASRIENYIARKGFPPAAFPLADALGEEVSLHSFSFEDFADLESSFRNRPIFSDPRRREILAVVSSLSLSLSLLDCGDSDLLVRLTFHAA